MATDLTTIEEVLDMIVENEDITSLEIMVEQVVWVARIEMKANLTTFAVKLALMHDGLTIRLG